MAAVHSQHRSPCENEDDRLTVQPASYWRTVPRTLCLKPQRVRPTKELDEETSYSWNFRSIRFLMPNAGRANLTGFCERCTNTYGKY